jgi:hypothetical protein
MQKVPELTPGKRAVGKIMVFQLFKKFSFFFSQVNTTGYYLHTDKSFFP